MPSSNLIRWGGIAAIVAGALYVVLVLFNPQGATGLSFIPSSLGRVMLIIAILGQLAGIASLHTLQRGSYGRLGAAGSLVAFVGFALQLISVVVISLGGGVAFAILLVLGILAPFVGLILLGVAALRAPVLPGWCGVLLIIGFPAVAVLVGVREAVLALVVFGVFWILVGYALLSSRSAQAQRPARVR